MNRYEICQSKRGNWYVKLRVGRRTFCQNLPFFETREEAEELGRRVADGGWFNASITYGGGDNA